MAIKLFEIKGKAIVPTEHCYMIKPFKKIIDEFPDNHIKVLAYIFYMTCRSEENPYFNRPQDGVEREILRDIGADFEIEHPTIVAAVQRGKVLYETPTVRAYEGISNMLEELANYMNTVTITDGRDGNIAAIVNAAKNFDSIRKSFKGVAKDLEEEQSSRARGGTRVAYDD
jgi:thioredoxin-related protein